MRGSRLVVRCLIVASIVALTTSAAPAAESSPEAEVADTLRAAVSDLEAGGNPTQIGDQGLELLDRLAGVELSPLTILVMEGTFETSGPDERAAVYEAVADLLDDTAGEPSATVPVETSPGRTGPGIPIWMALLSMGSIAALALAVGWYRRYSSRLEKLALVDPLTGLANRRRLDQDLAALEAARRAAREALSVAMIDVDFFKRFNDAFGHQEGDRALQAVGSTIAAAARPGDVVYRYGGEEFLVLMTNAAQSDAMDVCEGIRIAVASLKLALTVSVGVATGIREPLPTLTMAADEALFRAKEEGRNRVVATTVANLSGARVSPL